MKNEISKKLIICAAVSTLIFAAMSIFVFFSLFYRKNESVEVVFPDLEGSLESDIGEYSGLKIQKNYISSDIYPEGVVVSQSPKGLSGVKIKKGQTPTLTVNISTGREKFVLEDLAQKTLGEARTYLRGKLCQIKIIRLYGDFEQESISYTSPESGSVLSVGDRVTLYVNTPNPEEFVRVPNIVGLELDEALRVLRREGIAFEIESCYTDGASPNTVVLLEPAPEMYINKKTAVKITVNSD